MSLKEPILKILAKQYAQSSMIEQKFGRYDLLFKTDEEGRPILLFIGTKASSGNIIGERYARRLKIDDEGNTIKDHWELKGKAT
ncbi:hypothetical protein ABE426_05625 [Sphingobacterium faecium]|uniref:hypothetical protein n=1 Tax=Sphingobacterium faecium TaxID=34087 RepID=UPI00320843BC